VARAGAWSPEAEIALGLARPQLGCKHSIRPGDARSAWRSGERCACANLEARHLVLIGRLDEAEGKLAGLDPDPLPPASKAAH